MNDRRHARVADGGDEELGIHGRDGGPARDRDGREQGGGEHAGGHHGHASRARMPRAERQQGNDACPLHRGDFVTEERTQFVVERAVPRRLGENCAHHVRNARPFRRCDEVVYGTPLPCDLRQRAKDLTQSPVRVSQRSGTRQRERDGANFVVRHAPADSGCRYQPTPLERAGDGGDVHRIDLRGAGEQLRRQGHLGGGNRLEHAQLVWREHAEPPTDDGSVLQRAIELLLARAVPAVVVPSQDAAFDGQAQRLEHEQGNAVRAPPQQRRQGPRPRGVWQRCDAGDELLDQRCGQRGEANRRHGVAEQRELARRPRGEHEQHALVAQARGNECERAERLFVAPMEVVYDEREGCVVGNRRNELDEGESPPPERLTADGRIGRARKAMRERRIEREDGGDGVLRDARRPWQRGEFRRQAGERRVGDVPITGFGGAPYHAAARGDDAGAQVAREPRLPDAAIADDQRRARVFGVAIAPQEVGEALARCRAAGRGGEEGDEGEGFALS